MLYLTSAPNVFLKMSKKRVSLFRIPKRRGYCQIHKEWIALTLCLIGLFFLFGQDAFANNLLTNPNFENGINDWDVAGPDAVAAKAYFDDAAVSIAAYNPCSSAIYLKKNPRSCRQY